MAYPHCFDLYFAISVTTLVSATMTVAGAIVPAAKLLRMTRHALKRRIIKHRIEWPPTGGGQEDVG